MHNDPRPTYNRDSSPIALHLEKTIPYLGRFRAFIDKKNAAHWRRADKREIALQDLREQIAIVEGLVGSCTYRGLCSKLAKLEQHHRNEEHIHASHMENANRVQHEDVEYEMRWNPDVVARVNAQVSAEFIRQLLS